MMPERTEYIAENGIEYEVRVYPNGDKFWYLNGKLHRQDGPACEFAGGARFWVNHGDRHREDGPAIEHANGNKFWYFDGAHLTKEVREQGIDQLSPEDIRFWLPILQAQKA